MNFTLPDQTAHHCEHEASQSESSAGRRSGPTSDVRRLRFIARFIYWTVKHRSPQHAAWVSNFEGYKWN